MKRVVLILQPSVLGNVELILPCSVPKGGLGKSPPDLQSTPSQARPTVQSLEAEPGAGGHLSHHLLPASPSPGGLPQPPGSSHNPALCCRATWGAWYRTNLCWQLSGRASRTKAQSWVEAKHRQSRPCLQSTLVLGPWGSPRQHPGLAGTPGHQLRKLGGWLLS